MAGADPNIKEPTLVPLYRFDPLDDALRLKDALGEPQGAAVFIEILCTRVAGQRVQIVNTYNEHFKKDLYQEVKSAYSGNFSKLMRALLQDPFEYLAKEVMKAMAGIGTDEDVLTEVLCTRSKENILKIAEAFKVKYGKTIEEELENEYKVSSGYKDILGMLLSGIRDEERESDPGKARKRAENVFKSEQNVWSTETKIFMRMLTHESYPQLRLIFDEYRKISGQSMQEAITTEFGGDVRNAMLTIVKCALNRSQYYAEKLESKMSALRKFDNNMLIRIISTRSEIDLGVIKTEYLKIYHKTLFNQIRNMTSGDYRSALLALIGEP